jgi:hypothetical protein
MKAVAFAFGGGIVAFVAVTIYMQMDSPKKADSIPLVTELPPQPKPKVEDDEPAPPKKAAASPKRSAQSTRRQTPSKSPGANRAPVRKTMYFKAIYGASPIPDRVIIYNTQIGDLTILLLGTVNSTGELFHSRGVKDNHVWDVLVEDGYLSVYWDDKLVPPG